MNEYCTMLQDDKPLDIYAFSTEKLVNIWVKIKL